MDKEDGCKLSRQAQYERRKQAVRLHRQGRSFKEIAAALSLSENTARSAVKLAQADGLKALAPKPTGRAMGVKRRLSAEQELHIQRQICKHRPEQLQLSFALWTRAAVALLVEQEFGILLPVRTMSEYLKRWGFTPQRSITRAYEQRPEAVKAWLDEQYPQIAQRAKDEDAEIHWGDETAVVNTDVRGRGYQPKAQTPVAYAVGGTRHKLSDLHRDQPRQGALDDHRRGVQQRQADRVPRGTHQGLTQESVPDTGQPAGTSQQARQGLAGRASSADRGVLPAQL